MKINNKGELKALIKECLIEILSEGMPAGRSRQVERAERPTSLRDVQFARESQPQLPPSIPASMKSIFQDTQQRAATDLYKETTQTEVLGEMAETWEGMAFAGELPQRAFHPGQHKGAPVPQSRNAAPRSPIDFNHHVPSFAPSMDYDDDVSDDDGFDPLAAVLAARKSRG